MPLLIFIHSMTGQLICKYELFWHGKCSLWFSGDRLGPWSSSFPIFWNSNGGGGNFYISSPFPRGTANAHACGSATSLFIRKKTLHNCLIYTLFRASFVGSLKIIQLVTGYPTGLRLILNGWYHLKIYHIWILLIILSIFWNLVGIRVRIGPQAPGLF